MEHDQLFDKYIQARSDAYFRFYRGIAYFSGGFFFVFGIVFCVLFISWFPIILVLFGVFLVLSAIFIFPKYKHFLAKPENKERYLHDGGFIFISFAEYLIEEEKIRQHEQTLHL